MKKTKTSPKKKSALKKKPAAKKVVKKAIKKAPVKKKASIKASKPAKPAKVTHTKRKSEPAKTAAPTIVIKKNPNGMNYFQQCVVLAALINQERHQNHEFQTIPLPEITSTLLQPLREYLSQYAFNSEEIQNGLDDMVRCDFFKKTFPVKNTETLLDLNIQGNPKKIMAQLIELAGPEARKIIFLKEEGDRFLIHRTTLEKYALKTGQIENHILHHDLPTYMSHESTHREILNQINQRSNARYFNQDHHPQNLSSKHRRGRG